MTRRGLLALTLVGVDVSLWLLGIALLSLPRVQPFPQETATAPFLVLAFLAFAIVGAAIISRWPGHLVGWLFCASGVLLASEAPIGAYVGHLLVDPAAPFGGLARDLNGVAFWNGFLLPMTYGLLLFPDGRLPSPRWRLLAVLIGAVLAIFSIGPVLANHQLGGAREDVPPVLLVVALGCVVGVVASIVVRWRRARALERAQLKWIAATAWMFPFALVAYAVIGTLEPLDSQAGAVAFVTVAVTFLPVPVAIGIAILRYRLYDIDVLIRRTVIYGATTVGLALTFFGVIVLVEAILSPFTRGNELAVAASTLVSLTLFQRLRSRVQSAVDRRFYRSRYDAARTLDDFSVRLRDQVALEALRGDLESLVKEALATQDESRATRPLAEAGGLTRREEQIASLIAVGLGTRQISEQTGISQRTVETHVAHILAKLGFRSRSQVVAWHTSRRQSQT